MSLFNNYECSAICLYLHFSTGWSSSQLERLIAGTPSYSKLGADLITFSLGLAKDSYPEYIWEVTTEQELAAVAYTNALQSPWTDIKKFIQERLQKLLYVLFTEKSTTVHSRYRSTVYRFLILYSFCKEGGIDYCGTITQHISKLVFLGRCAIYQKIQQEMQKRGDIGFFS